MKDIIKKTEEYFKDAEKVIAMNTDLEITLTTKKFVYDENSDCVNEVCENGELLKTGTYFNCVYNRGKFSKITKTIK
jgi:hypothetical protein